MDLLPFQNFHLPFVLFFVHRTIFLNRNGERGAGNVGATSAPQQMGMSRNNDDIVRALTSQNSILKEQNTLLLQIVKNTSK